MNTRFYNAKILETRDDHTFYVRTGELWVEGSRISYIGDTVADGVPETAWADTSKLQSPGREAAVPRFPTWDREIDAGGDLLIPGFCNAHTHTAMTFLRSYADDLPLQEWLTQKIFPQEAKLTEEDAYYLAILGIMEYLSGGITSCFDMYIYPRAVARAVKDTGFRGAFTSGLNDFTSSPEGLLEDYHFVNELCGRTKFYVGFHAEYTTGKKRLEAVARLADELRSPVWFHNAETKKEVMECRERYGRTPTELAEELGMFCHGGGGYHCIWFSDEDFAIFKKRGLTVVTNPASNLKLASGICPTKRFLDEGISMAIGTDGPASNNALDMFREMYLVTTLAKVREERADCVPAEEVLYMATLGGAKAQGFDAGKLSVGMSADLVMIDLKQPNMQPENDLVKNLVYSGGTRNVKLTMVDGTILYEDGRFDIGFSPEEIYARANGVLKKK